MDLQKLEAFLANTMPKVWGTTRCVAESHAYQVHELCIEPGGYCSVHRHASKDNIFIGLGGEIVVRQFESDPYFPVVSKRSEDLVSPRHNPLHVPAGIWHQFVNVSDDEAVVLELYIPTAGRLAIDDPDIERHSEGGNLNEDNEDE